MSISNKAGDKVTFAVIAALIATPVITSAIGAVKGWNATYEKGGFYLAYHGAEAGSEMGGFIGAGIDVALIGLGYGVARLNRKVRRPSNSGPK